jgi:methionyl-tRNA formyltransferase
LHGGAIIPADVSLFLFCNDNYGTAYAEVAAKRVRERGLDIRVVLSGKRRPRRVSGPATRLGLRVHVTSDVNSRRFLERVEPGDHAVIAGFDQIFRESAIARFASFVNFHPSLLPYYRGPWPSYWCIKNRETHTGFSLHRVTPVIDSGEILHQEIVPVGDAAHPRELDRRIAARGARTFERWIEHLVTGADWRPSALVDARAVYQKPLDYAHREHTTSSRSFATRVAPESFSR